jgi:hypothetical protein
VKQVQLNEVDVLVEQRPAFGQVFATTGFLLVSWREEFQRSDQSAIRLMQDFDIGFAWTFECEMVRSLSLAYNREKNGAHGFHESYMCYSGARALRSEDSAAAKRRTIITGD